MAMELQNQGKFFHKIQSKFIIVIMKHRLNLSIGVDVVIVYATNDGAEIWTSIVSIKLSQVELYNQIFTIGFLTALVFVHYQSCEISDVFHI